MNKVRPVVAILDDEEKMRKALGRLLRIHGFDVETFSTGAALLANLPSPLLDCLVMDLHMPELNGFEVLQSFAMRQETLPVIVVTGHDVPGNEERARRLGAADFLLKPVDEATLLQAIRRGMNHGR